MRNTTKLAGTKDMAKITQMDTSTSTEVVILEGRGREGEREEDKCSVRWNNTRDNTVGKCSVIKVVFCYSK